MNKFNCLLSIFNVLVV